MQFAVFGSLPGLGLLIYAFVKGGAVLGFSALLWLPLAVGWLFVMGLLSALFAGGQAASFADFTGGSGTAYLWTDAVVPVWAVVLIIALAVLSAVSYTHLDVYKRQVVGAAIALVLSMLGAAISGDSNGSFADQLNDQVDDLSGVDPGASSWKWIFFAPFQLAAMAALTPLRLIMSSEDDRLSGGCLLYTSRCV